MRFLKHFLDEKLQPSQFRNYIRAWKASGISSFYDDAFGDKDRIYLPFEGKVTGKKINRTQEAVQMILNRIGDWKIQDYVQGTAVKDGKVMKIGKLINRYIERLKSEGDNDNYSLLWAENIYRMFIGDKHREAMKSKLLICISRHAYDIVGMSTDRGWTSCQNLKDGSMKGFVMKDIKAGTIIAYLIKEDDKNIQRPLGRLLLKPFYNQDTNEMIVAPSKEYGTVPENFRDEVYKWVKKNINKNASSGTYKIDPTVYKGSDIRGIKIIKNPIPMKEFRAKQRELRVPMVETPEQFLTYWNDPEHFHYIKNNRTEFLAGLGKKIIGRVYFKKGLLLNADQVWDVFMRYYWTELKTMPSYHNLVNDIIMENFTKVGQEIDDAWAVLSIFTGYDAIHHFPLNVSWDKILEGINHILDESHKKWFSNRYIRTPEDRQRIIDKCKVFFTKYGKGH